MLAVKLTPTLGTPVVVGVESFLHPTIRHNKNRNGIKTFFSILINATNYLVMARHLLCKYNVFLRDNIV